jgi:hypothetical protein
LSRQRHFTDVLKWQECPLDPGIERASFVAELAKMADKKQLNPRPRASRAPSGNVWPRKKVRKRWQISNEVLLQFERTWNAFAR